jgi:hypothetical protein
MPGLPDYVKQRYEHLLRLSDRRFLLAFSTSPDHEPDYVVGEWKESLRWRLQQPAGSELPALCFRWQRACGGCSQEGIAGEWQQVDEPPVQLLDALQSLCEQHRHGAVVAAVMMQ